MDYPKNIFNGIWPDPIGVLLGTGFQRFEAHNGLDGLCKAGDGKIELLELVVDEKDRNRGTCREFIKACCDYYHRVRVLHVDNPILEDALIRWGFTKFECVDEFGDKVEGYEKEVSNVR